VSRRPLAQVEEEAEFKLQRERSAAGSNGADGGGGGLFGRFEQSSTRLVLFRADKSSPARWVEV